MSADIQNARTLAYLQAHTHYGDMNEMSLDQLDKPLSPVREDTSAESFNQRVRSQGSGEDLNISEFTGPDKLEMLDNANGRPPIHQRMNVLEFHEHNTHSISSGRSSSKRKSKHHRHHHRHDWLFVRENPYQYNKYDQEYWSLPRMQNIFHRQYETPELPGPYLTPGDRLYPRYSRSPRSSKRGHKHKHDGTHSSVIERQVNKDLEGDTMDFERNLEDDRIPHRSELKVYFRFSKGTLSNGSGLDYYQNEPYLVALQSYCRGWLTRQTYDRLREENEAVRIIQRNAERLFNPWVRLMLALRPLLKSNRIEEELLYLRSELERYKTLVKMLRYENAEYQSKVANLLQLIEQINSKGANSEVVSNLVSQITELLAKNQDFWQRMAVNNEALQAVTLQRPPRLTDVDGSPIMPPSPMTQLRQDADFYRNQVEMLKEEADEQQYRSSEHFRGQVNVLSDRVEHLQHLLALESSKVERLSAELEEMNGTIAEAKNYERNLEHMVSQLSRQLEQKTKALDTPTTEKAELNGSTKDSDTKKMVQELHSYKSLLNKLRQYFSDNPKAMAALTDSPFEPGSELDLFNEPPHSSDDLIQLERVGNQKVYAKPPSPTKNDYATFDDLTIRVAVNEEVTDLKRQLVEAEKNLTEKGEQIKSEMEEREVVETENNQLRNRITTLERQLRDLQEDYDENISRKELLTQRQLKEMTEQLEEEARKISLLTQQNRDMERELTDLRNLTEPDEEILNDEWESMKSKLRADVSHYKRSLELLQEEFDQFRRQNDPQKTREDITEKEEKINMLEREKQQWRLEMEVLQVKFQNATTLLEDTENRLKWATREKTAQMHRLQQLEGERDEAIREAATISGRASAEKESIVAKLREFEELRIERDGLRRELTDLKQTLAGCTAETSAEKRQLQARLRELEVHHEARISDLKSELERAREDLERLQVDLQTAQSSEVELKASSQKSRWKIDTLEDQLSNAMRRITNLERRNTDLEAELVRAKADLSVSREAASLKRASRSRIADEWIQGGYDGSTTEEDEKTQSTSDRAGKQDGLVDNFSETSTSPRMRRRAPYPLRPSSLCRSSSSIFRPINSLDGRLRSNTDKFMESRASNFSLNKGDAGVQNSNHKQPWENSKVITDDTTSNRTDLTPVNSTGDTVSQGLFSGLEVKPRVYGPGSDTVEDSDS